MICAICIDSSNSITTGSNAALNGSTKAMNQAKNAEHATGTISFEFYKVMQQRTHNVLQQCCIVYVLTLKMQQSCI